MKLCEELQYVRHFPDVKDVLEKRCRVSEFEDRCIALQRLVHTAAAARLTAEDMTDVRQIKFDPFSRVNGICSLVSKGLVLCRYCASPPIGSRMSSR